MPSSNMVLFKIDEELYIIDNDLYIIDNDLYIIDNDLSIIDKVSIPYFKVNVDRHLSFCN